MAEPDTTRRADCTFDFDHTRVVCPFCEPERNRIGPAQLERLKLMIRERGLRSE